MKKYLLLPLALSASMANADSQICLNEYSTTDYDDIIVCFTVGAPTTWAFGVTTYPVTQGVGWNRHGGFAPLSGSIMTGNDQNGVPSYFFSWTANLNQEAQKNPNGVGFYIVAGNYVIKQSEFGNITPNSQLGNPSYAIGVSYREDIMVNASLFSNCTTQPWTCWDVQTGFNPPLIYQIDPNNVPFNPFH